MGPRACPEVPPRRLRKLPLRSVLGREVPVAVGLRARTLGLSLLDREQAGAGLLIPRCGAVHTFGMRFALDLCFLDAAGRPLRWRRSVRPRRFCSCPGACAVLELPAGESRPRRRLEAACFRSERR